MIVMEGGRIVCSGPPADVLPRVEDQLTVLEEVDSEGEGATVGEAKKEDEEHIHEVSAESIDNHPPVSVSVFCLSLFLGMKEEDFILYYLFNTPFISTCSIIV